MHISQLCFYLHIRMLFIVWVCMLQNRLPITTEIYRKHQHIRFQGNKNKSNQIQHTYIHTYSCVAFTFFFFWFILQVVGPKLMENRKPFNLRYTLILYNFIQVIFSAWLFYEVSAVLQLSNLNFLHIFRSLTEPLSPFVITPISLPAPHLLLIYSAVFFVPFFFYLIIFFYLISLVCAFLRIVQI